MNVEITIDELVLRGVPPEQTQALLAALQGHLAARAARWAAAGDGHGDLIERAEASRRLPTVEAPVESPDLLGEAVAGSVWSALAGGGGGGRR